MKIYSYIIKSAIKVYLPNIYIFVDLQPYLAYGLPYGHYLGKREAEAEPEADAKPWLYGAYAHPALVSPHAIGATGQTVSVEAAAAGHLATKVGQWCLTSNTSSFLIL